MNPRIALHLLQCLLLRGQVQHWEMHVGAASALPEAAAAMEHCVHVLGLGERAEETQFCPRRGPATRPDQGAWLTYPSQEHQSVTLQVLLSRMGSSHLLMVVLKKDRQTQMSVRQTLGDRVSVGSGTGMVNSFGMVQWRISCFHSTQAVLSTTRMWRQWYTLFCQGAG